MKRIATFLAAAVIGAFMVACSITLPVTTTGNTVGSKVGTSSGSCYLSALCFGVDASIKSAAKNGNIKKISTVDLKRKDVLGLITTFETQVTGE